MCGFYSREEIGRDAYKEYFAVEKVAQAQTAPRYNIRPKTYNPVVLRNSPNKAHEMLWWFHPGWPNFPENRGVINARIESLKENKPFFKKAILNQRCIIPASHWVEWKEINGVKIPYAFKLKSRKFFGFAGLWNEYTDSLGKNIQGYAIITVTPNSIAAAIHNRQPAVLREKDHESWLDPQESDTTTLFACLETYPENDIETYPVRRDLSENSPDNMKPLTKSEFEAQMIKKHPPKKAKVALGEQVKLL